MKLYAHSCAKQQITNYPYCLDRVAVYKVEFQLDPAAFGDDGAFDVRAAFAEVEYEALCLPEFPVTILCGPQHGNTLETAAIRALEIDRVFLGKSIAQLHNPPLARS